jgi:hypothetical protein
LEKLVYFKLKSLNLLKRAHAAVNRVGGLIENKYGDDDERNLHVGISCGGDVESKSCSTLTVDFNDDRAVTKVEEFTAPLDEVSKDGVCVVFRIKSD